MKFIVTNDVFKEMDNLCFGVIVAKGINNAPNDEIAKLLESNEKLMEEKYDGKKAKEIDEIICYRDAFKSLGINPNKYMSSIEAIATRIVKRKGFPNINSIVDLGNAISIKHLVPLGAHDINASKEDISVRFSKAGDIFIPFGGESEEVLEDRELIYSAGNHVRTRRWIWRQSEEGKITEDTKDVFFPIDGFKDKNLESVISARDELADLLKKYFNCEIKVGMVDSENNEFEF